MDEPVKVTTHFFLGKSKGLLQFLVRLFQTRCEFSTLQVAWRLYWYCAARALDFDARVSSFQDFAPVARVFQDALVCALQKFLCVSSLTALEVRTCLLPAKLGGLGIPDMGITHPAAYLSSKCAVWPFSISLLRSIGWSEPRSLRWLPLESAF